METIHPIAQVRWFARFDWPALAFFVIAVILLFFVRLQAESYHYGLYYDDEYHTVYQGLNLLVHGQVDNFRAQEGTRWLVRAFYPYALIYMNTHMGGNVYLDGWSYPGHNYVIKNYIELKGISPSFSNDPNLRNLFHALRQLYILFVFAAVTSLLLFFLLKKRFYTAFGGILLLGLSLDLLNEQQLFYIEPAMLASLALLLLAYFYCHFNRIASYPMVILLGFLAAFTVSTKFSTLFFLLLPFVLFFDVLQRNEALRRSAAYIALIIVFYALINFPAFVSLQSFNVFLHDLSSNFWQYAAGSDSSITVAPGISHLGLIVYQLEDLFGYALYALPLLILFALYHANREQRMMLVPLAVVTLFSIHSLAGQHIYMHRNLVPFYLPLALFALFCLEIVVRRLGAVFGWRGEAACAAILGMLWLTGILIHAGGPTAFRNAILPNARSGFIMTLQNMHPRKPEHWYAVGFQQNFFSGAGFADKIVSMEDVPAVLHDKNYPALVARFETLPQDAVVLINRIGNNKHLTNYILPRQFNRNIQFGSYYAFFNLQ